MKSIFLVDGQRNQIVDGEPLFAQDRLQELCTDQDPWKRLLVVQLSKGDWYVARIRAGKFGGNGFEPVEITEGTVIVKQVEWPFGITMTEEESAQAMVNEAMDFFGWTWLAKELAAQANWSVCENIS